MLNQESAPTAFRLSQAFSKNPASSLVYVTSSQKRAHQLKQDLEFFVKIVQVNSNLQPGLPRRPFGPPRNDKGHETLLLNQTSTLPYTGILPELDLTADLLAVYHQLKEKKPFILILPIQAWQKKLAPPTIFEKHKRRLCQNQLIDRSEVTKWLLDAGYTHAPLVEDNGTFAVRGGILDIYSPGENSPARIELDGDQISSIRSFDPASQRSLKRKESYFILPARETLYEEEASALKQRLKKIADAQNLPANLRRPVQEYVNEKICFNEMATFLPIFYSKLNRITDYLPDDYLLLSDPIEELKEGFQIFYQDLCELHQNCHSFEKIIPPELLWEEKMDCFAPSGLAMTENAEFITSHRESKGRGDPVRTIVPARDCRVAKLLPITATSRVDLESPFRPVAEQISKWCSEKMNVHIVAHTELGQERIEDLLKWHKVEAEIPIHLGKLSSGFLCPDEKIIFLTELELFGKRGVKKLKANEARLPISSFSDLSQGDYLVHDDKGVGRYQGLKHLTFGDVDGDFLILEYLGDDILYLPTYHIGKVQKYVGGRTDTPFLDRLGGTRWRNAKKKAKEAAYKIAQELLNIHAERKLAKSHAYPPEDHMDEEFATYFPYDETPDQAQAITDVLKDLQEEAAMDRLICGDVGYGKTEVAMRATFKIISSGRQACLLVPTTVLALQHYENFLERFKQTGAQVEMLSRFRSRKEQVETLTNISKGITDIVIGTHRLLSSDVRFKKLGLLIIDEEQRFGVRHKEKIKKLKAAVDVLSLSATPIPRTLHMSLIGLKNLSLIHTPPADRLSIRTYIAKFEDSLIKHAINKELSRAGQVFFIHNRVKTIGSILKRVQKLFPKAKIAIAHGQMPESELEKIMVKFSHQKIDILICTTIVESGLDVPNANTMIIHRADTFGLAQLYQLRGRIGRSDRQAHCYLLIPEEELMTTDAKRRLQILTRFTELGSGFQIASQDLEIRGAGNLLGSSQSGFIEEVGYDLYTRLLNRTIRKLRGEKILEEIEPEINLGIPAYLPDDYIPDQQIRIDLYKRLAHLNGQEEFLNFSQEIVDRFGFMPPQVDALLETAFIKTQLEKIRATSLSQTQGKIVLELDSSSQIIGTSLISFVQNNASYSFKPPSKIVINMNNTELNQLLTEIKKAIALLVNLG